MDRIGHLVRTYGFKVPVLILSDHGNARDCTQAHEPGLFEAHSDPDGPGIPQEVP